MWCEIGSWPSLATAVLQENVRTLHPLRTTRTRRIAVALGIALTVAACSSIDSMFEEDAPPTARTTTSGDTGNPTDKDYPKLSTVPARPERPTPPPQQGLAADRESARYADGSVQPVNEAANAVVGQSLGGSTRPPPSNATVAAAPAGPVQSAPVTPVQAQPQQAPAQSAAPVQQAPVQQAPVQQPAAQQSPVQQAPVQQAPVQQTQVQQPQVQPAPAQPAPAVAAPVAPPVAATLPPPPPPSRQALILPPTTRPPVGQVVAGRAPAAAPAPVYYGNTIQVAVVQFGRASSGLSSDDLRVLRDVAEIQKKQGGVIRVIGHASQDASGSDVERLEQANYAVSLARANAIAGQLVRFGVPRNAVTVEGASDRLPEFDPSTAVAVASNRRAEIYLAF
ncbi:MAG: OmpA family protein [Reyranellaceae bacterium]